MSATSAPSVPSAARAGRAVGAMFFSVFGTVWLVAGDIVARGGVDWTLAPIVAAGLFLLASALRRFHANRGAHVTEEGAARSRRIARVFHWVNGGQWVLAIVLAIVLNNTGHGEWVVAMVMAVVGLHFLPLAAVMSYRAHYVSGVALTLLAVVFPFVTAAGPQSAVGPIGAGLILWASAIYALTAGTPTANDTTAGRPIVA